MEPLTGELGGYLAASGRVWVDKPKLTNGRKPVQGPPVLGSRELQISDALKAKDRERIKAEARAYAAEVMAAFDRKEGRRWNKSSR